LAGFVFQRLEDADRLNVGADLLLWRADADLVGIRDAVVGAGALFDAGPGGL
jgi:hypothetical protein